ncbi:MAG TPA: cytochrome c [Bryobacteraceae bacterium]|nr:cytochrome c [Bryobacteraceae bacterium]
MKRLVLMCATVLLAGCATQSSRNTPVTIIPDMDYQERYEPQGDRTFYKSRSEKEDLEKHPIFGDNRASRRPVEGTIARGTLVEDDGFATGVVDNMYIGRNPLKVDAELLAHGQRRFNTYCSPCHDRTGQGRGLVGQRAVWIPTNLHEPRVKDMNDGEIFNVVTNGRRSMPPYRFQVVDRDRWAIVAYVRALQRATTGTVAEVPEDKRAELK